MSYVLKYNVFILNLLDRNTGAQQFNDHSPTVKRFFYVLNKI